MSSVSTWLRSGCRQRWHYPKRSMEQSWMPLASSGGGWNMGKSFTVIRRSEPVFKISPPEEEELWETTVDFTEFNENGISAKGLLKRLKRLHG